MSALRQRCARVLDAEEARGASAADPGPCRAGGTVGLIDKSISPAVLVSSMSHKDDDPDKTKEEYDQDNHNDQMNPNNEEYDQ